MVHSYAYCGISVDSGFKIESEGGFGEWTWMQDIKPATKEQRDFLFTKMKEAGYEWDSEKKELKKIVVPIFKIGDTIIKKHNSDILYFGLFTITDITGGKYWYNDRIICDITEQDEWEIYEPVSQKSAEWSEEDNAMLISIENILIGRGHSFHDKEINWVKSLKDRVLPQPKQEWSEEDKKMLDNIIVDVEVLKTQDKTKTGKEAYQREIDWLKSLRSQTTWKPSDKQIEALEFAADCIVPAEFCFKRKELKGLLEQLKKLREV
jgi:hypothetical protein